MKKFFVIVLTILSMFVASICFAEGFQVDTNRWVKLSDNPNGEHIFYQDVKTITVDTLKNTASIWIMDICKNEDKVTLFNIQFKYPVRTYAFKATILKKLSDGSVIDSYYNPYLDEKVLVPESLFEQLYEINDPTKPEIKENRECALPDTGIKIIVPANLLMPITRKDANEKFKNLAETVFSDKTVYYYSRAKEGDVELIVTLENTMPGDVKDSRELKKKFEKEDYLESDEFKGKIKELENKQIGLKVIAVDKHISKNAIFMSILANVKHKNINGYIKTFKTVRNSRLVSYTVSGSNQKTVCEIADGLFSSLTYID